MDWSDELEAVARKLAKNTRTRAIARCIWHSNGLDCENAHEFLHLCRVSVWDTLEDGVPCEERARIHLRKMLDGPTSASRDVKYRVRRRRTHTAEWQLWSVPELFPNEPATVADVLDDVGDELPRSERELIAQIGNGYSVRELALQRAGSNPAVQHRELNKLRTRYKRAKRHVVAALKRRGRL